MEDMCPVHASIATNTRRTTQARVNVPAIGVDANRLFSWYHPIQPYS